MIVKFIWNKNKFPRSSVWNLIRMFFFDIAVAVCYIVFGWTWLSTPYIPVSVLGGAISVLIGFRNTSAYQRWWEARTIWGGIVNTSRTFGRQAISLLRPNSPEEESELAAMRIRIAVYQIAWVNALRCQLRGQDVLTEIARLLSADELDSLRGKPQVAIEILKRISLCLKECFERGWLDSIRFSAMDATLTELTNGQGASERIKTTPLPRQYDMLPSVLLGIYCLLLPFGIVESAGWLTPIGSTLVALVLAAWNQVGIKLENPFENQETDISLSAICRTIEISLRQQLGETNLPEPLRPVEGVLW
jgi:ion channel-forming bestrophin family protein